MTDIEKSLLVNATPEEVYSTLITSKNHSELTGGPAEIDPTEGGKFSTFGGSIYGYHTKLVENEIIEQNWRVKDFPENFYTKVSFKIEKTSLGTKITFSHKDIPDPAAEMIEQGWNKNYWDNMATYFQK
ncbi:MAG: SRPBCC domain-containing protein [Candidatus Kariarchaeaceae archaeon]|jgi:activator of HSP90 ATPase